MSERGSFVTEYIYCDRCFAEAKRILIYCEKHMCSTVIPGWSVDERELPIIAGKIGGLYLGEELDIMGNEFVSALSRAVCHPLRVAVLADNGDSEVFVAKPHPDTVREYT